MGKGDEGETEEAGAVDLGVGVLETGVAWVVMGVGLGRAEKEREEVGTAWEAAMGMEVKAEKGVVVKA